MTLTEGARFIDLCDDLGLTIAQREHWQEFIDNVSDDAYDRGANAGRNLEIDRNESEKQP